MDQEEFRLDRARGGLPGIDVLGRCEQVVVQMGAATDVGKRSRNDDSYAYDQGLRFACVADGVGGAPYGGVAARVACSRALEQRRIGLGLEESFVGINAFVSSLSRYLGGAASTLLMAGVGARSIALAWVGDSVCYRLRKRSLDLLTPRGRASGPSNALESGLGYRRSRCHVAKADARAGDRLVLCTDGVWENVSGARMTKLLGEGDAATGIAKKLVREAVGNGRDNATCVVMLLGNKLDVPSAF